jgi:xanthine dehydrogenase accessory factor
VCDIAAELRAWCADDKRFALVTVVGATGSSPHPLGAMMAVAEDGAAIGSVAGGCVEGAVYELALDVLACGEAALETYGVSEDQGLTIGLSCGGVIDLLVAEPDRAVLSALLDCLEADETAALVTALTGPVPRGAMLAITAHDVQGSLDCAKLDAAVIADTRTLLAADRTGVVHHRTRGDLGVAVLVQSFRSAPRMLVFGGTAAAAVVRVGVFLGYRVTVCEARPVFASRQRFPEAQDVVCEWPARFLRREAENGRVDARTAIIVLTHDSKFDVPLLQVALCSTAAAYVGAMGSRRTHEDRLRRLRAVGVDDDSLARLRSPIGLDLGSRSVQETAVSIAAELVQSRCGGTGRPLRELDGPIHAQATGSRK